MTVLEKDDSDDDDDRPMMGSSFPELDYLQELIAIQKDCPKEIGFFGTRNMGFLHQQLIEILAYALCLTGNHIFTSGATGTNAAVIRGSLRAERPELLTVRVAAVAVEATGGVEGVVREGESSGGVSGERSFAIVGGE